MKNKWMVFGKILVVLGMVQVLTGCVTDKLWEKRFEITRDVEKLKNEFSDEITASFQYKKLDLTPAQQESFQLPEQGVGFVSENFVYFMKDGQALLEIDQLFKAIPLRQLDNKGIIHLEVSMSKTADEPTIFKNTITLYPQQETGKLSPEELSKLVAAGFFKKNNRYEKDIVISGLMFGKSATNTQFDSLKPITETRKVQFYSMDTKKQISVGGILQQILRIPATAVTLAVDIILLPAEIILMLMIFPCNACFGG